MGSFNRVESTRLPEAAIYNEVVLAGDGWMHDLEPGQVLRIVDLEGNQAADTLFFDADNPEDHYSAVATITNQQNIYLTTGSVLLAESGKELVKIVADTCGRHDTVGGSCSAQSNTVRYAHEKLHMHNCRDTFMLQLAQRGEPYNKRDLAPNVNFFMNVPVTPEGGLKFDDGVSSPGAYVEMQSVGRTAVLISNCPQLNNPCNAYNPTPIRVLIWNH
ncbi:urea amidolyase associated protein UAAP2 [Paenibacillus sp. JDR-2]|uniref:urea amidolyase associated protein UAAP2 n=1 Tax=Paenibacillus sp. (strain JDR-2) TaxID=324057 RepID=UPI000166C06F|nr:urea amidolyase associated protein UAAP2 [Paenibacillus sp. JDR-2]ACT01456.1 urea carboxylase-associated protein 1 [Paenibacillus sp. JDR-2]